MLLTAARQDEEMKITSTKELAEYFLKKVDGTENFSDDEKAEKTAKIIKKLKMGMKLTQEELRFLRKTNPTLYAHAMRVQMRAEAIEEQLKRAKSKEEAARVIATVAGSIAKDDPDREYLVASVSRISREMHQSRAYNRLPNTDADVQKMRERREQIRFEDAEENEEEKNLMNWSPLQEIMDAKPKFEAGA